jgi:hypothetical protein
MSYCVEQKGMNQPLSLTPDQVTSNPAPTSSGDINPKPDTTGYTFTSLNPVINVVLKETTTVTVIYLPNDRPNKPSNVNQFVVTVSYPDGRTPDELTSTTPTSGATTTTTPSPSGSETTPSSNAVILPSSSSPQVNLPTNYRLPVGAVISITIISTTNQDFPRDVRSKQSTLNISSYLFHLYSGHRWYHRLC